MKLGIMQPYFFPYLGYWQLMNAVDKYVIYDDVNFIKGGRINRNTILLNGQPHQINLRLLKASPNKLINEISVLPDKIARTKLLKTITAAYGEAPYFSQVYPLLEAVILSDEDNLAEFLANSFRLINQYLEIKTELILSSGIDKNVSLKAKEKVLQICQLLNADDYCNSIGGLDLYDKESFAEKGISLHYLKINEDISYTQFNNDFLPNLSIIDVMMFNSVDKIQEMLNMYELV